jgi:hypothetical protein
MTALIRRGFFQPEQAATAMGPAVGSDKPGKKREERYVGKMPHPKTLGGYGYF